MPHLADENARVTPEHVRQQKSMQTSLSGMPWKSLSKMRESGRGRERGGQMQNPEPVERGQERGLRG